MILPPRESLLPVTSINLAYERDVVVARQQGRKVAELAGFVSQDQIRIATAISEIARNAFQYARGGTVEYEVAQSENPALLVTVSDKGPGITDLEAVLSGRYESRTGMGNGLIGTQRLMDLFKIETSVTGTTVIFGKQLPQTFGPVTKERVENIRAGLAKQIPDDPFYELQRQNQELMRTLDELRARQIELAQLNAELEATNRGVVALYAELDERATYLRRTSELKTQFLSNMTHEFRTPLHSIRMLATMLLDRVDGPLSSEQEKQVRFILKGAEELSGFVDNLLDLAKVEAGRLTLRLASFNIHSLFDVLKGMLKPLTKESAVNLVFEEPHDNLELYSDEGKVSQILRNFISNALKFTNSGEVRVSVDRSVDAVVFSVSDTGMGIDKEHLELIFEEFGQVRSAQANTAGTGLGLPLSRRLATLLGGKVWVESEKGKGSRFYLKLPERKQVVDEVDDISKDGPRGNRLKVVIIDDDEVVRYVLQTQLEARHFQVLQAPNGEEGLNLIDADTAAVFLDMTMPRMSGIQVLNYLRNEERLAKVPVIICTSLTVDDKQRAELLSNGAIAVISKGGNFATNAMEALTMTLNLKHT